MTNEIKALVTKQGELEDQLQQVKKLIHQAKCDAAGLHEGDVVERRGVQYKVSRIEFWYDEARPSSLYGYKRLKDGGWHSKAQYISGSDFQKVGA